MAPGRAQGTLGRADPLRRPLPAARPRRSVAADPKGDWFTFEKGATKATGGEGWADVFWRKGCFGWEYKGRHKDLEAAHRQLLMYAAALRPLDAIECRDILNRTAPAPNVTLLVGPAV